MPSVMVIFANSAGWREKPPGIASQEREPLMVAPSGVSTSSASTTDSP